MPNAPLPRLIALAAVLWPALPGPALAHPHVWIVARAEIAYEGGRVVGVRHTWRFDAAYSAYVTQGLDANRDGRLAPEELQSLAEENTTNLAEFGYFTTLKVAGREQAFAGPREARMAFVGDRLALSFLLPLKAPPAQGRAIATFEVYDPTYFVSFELADGADAVSLKGAPAGCAVSLTRPKAPEAQAAEAGPPAGQPVGEAFFEALTAASTYGVQFANRALVACP